MKSLKLLQLCLFFILGLCIYGQNANDYLFNSTLGSYTEISGGTVLGTTSNDDQSFIGTTSGGTGTQTGAGFAIGFTFLYRGIAYNYFAVNTNGWIRLGTGTFSIANSYVPISVIGTSFENVFAAIGRDLQGQTGSELSYLLTGSSPNQCLVIQWKNYRRYNVSSESYNFQIRLYETTNIIQFVYGAFTVNYTGTTHPQVGIKGLVNTDYHNRTTTSDWSATTKGSSNTATCTLTTTVKPVSGTTFTFTPPSGPTNPPTFTATPVSNSQVDLSFTLDPNNDSVLILWSGSNSFTPPSGAPPATGQPFAGGTVLYKGKTSPVNHTSLTSNTLYYYKAFSYSLGTYSPGSLQSATTFCDAVSSFPLTESFDGTTFAPACWTNNKTAGAGTPGTWDRQTSGTYPTCTPHSGAGMARYNSYSYAAGTQAILVSPPMNIPSNNYLVKFWMYRDVGYPTKADLVNVYYNTVGNLTGATLLGTVNRSTTLAPVVASQGWYEYNFNLPSGSMGNNRFVIFEAVSQFGNNIFVDDVEITTASAMDGTVVDYNGNPVVGATVAKVGGILTVSGADGYYLLNPLFSGSQQFLCSKTGYNTVTETINIPYGATLNHDFTLLQPQMDIFPSAISVILLPSETGTSTLSITNNGSGNLDWISGVCQYSIKLFDTYGDGWNGGTLDVMVNGVVVLDNITLLSGMGPETFNFTAGNGCEITTVFTAGSYPVEPYYSILDCSSTEVWYSVPGNPTGPVNILPGQLVVNNLPPWIALNPHSGTVAPFGGAQTVQVILDATTADAGSPGIPGMTYWYNLVLGSIPDVGTKTIPISLTIADPNAAGPVNFRIDAINSDQGRIRLMWDYWADAVIDHFIIERNGVITGSTKKLQYVDTVIPGEYCYKIYAVYDNGHISPPSNLLCFRFPLDPRIPLAPWALLIGAGMILGWTVYLVRRKI